MSCVCENKTTKCIMKNGLSYENDCFCFQVYLQMFGLLFISVYLLQHFVFLWNLCISFLFLVQTLHWRDNMVFPFRLLAFITLWCRKDLFLLLKLMAVFEILVYIATNFKCFWTDCSHFSCVSPFSFRCNDFKTSFPFYRLYSPPEYIVMNQLFRS